MRGKKSLVLMGVLSLLNGLVKFIFGLIVVGFLIGVFIGSINLAFLLVMGKI